MAKRVQFLIVAILIFNNSLFSQSLSIEETINYLNKLSSENPYNYSFEWGTRKGYFNFSLAKDGLMKVYATRFEYDNRQKKTPTPTKDTSWFYIEDIDLNNIETERPDEQSFTLWTKNKYREIDVGSVFGKGSTISFYTSNHYNKMRFYNAMKYLISSALAQGYKRGDKTILLLKDQVTSVWQQTAHPRQHIK